MFLLNHKFQDIAFYNIALYFLESIFVVNEATLLFPSFRLTMFLVICGASIFIGALSICQKKYLLLLGNLIALTICYFFFFYIK